MLTPNPLLALLPKPLRKLLPHPLTETRLAPSKLYRLRLPKPLILPSPVLLPVERATEAELKRERPAAGVLAEAVLKPLRLPVWKVTVDWRDMAGWEAARGAPEVDVPRGMQRVAGGAPGPLGFYGPAGGAGHY